MRGHPTCSRRVRGDDTAVRGGTTRVATRCEYKYLLRRRSLVLVARAYDRASTVLRVTARETYRTLRALMKMDKHEKGLMKKNLPDIIEIIKCNIAKVKADELAAPASISGKRKHESDSESDDRRRRSTSPPLPAAPIAAATALAAAQPMPGHLDTLLSLCTSTHNTHSSRSASPCVRPSRVLRSEGKKSDDHDDE